MSDALKHYQSEFERLRTAQSDTELQNLREAALENLQSNGFPTRKQESWKYTDVRKLLKQDFQFNLAAPEIAQSCITESAYEDPTCYRLVFINGVYSAAHSDTEIDEQGIIITDLKTATQQHKSTILEHLAENTNSTVNGFTALNTALLQQGSFIQIEKNTTVNKPVHLLHINTGQPTPFSNQLRNLIIAGENASLTLIESFNGIDDAVYFTNTVTEIRLQQSSRVTHHRIQQETKNSFHLGFTSVSQGRDSYYESNAISLGAELSRTDLNCRLEASGAETNLNGLYMVNGEQHSDQHIKIDHLVANTQSKQNYRGIMDDRSRAVFNGKVVVHKGADKTDAQQSNANLLLSNDAEIDTKPELEIYADDVKCSHGATVGQLDPDMLFYLRSRAIDETTARSLLTFAFADEVIRNIKIRAIRDRLEQRVMGQLPDANVIREFADE